MSTPTEQMLTQAMSAPTAEHHGDWDEVRAGAARIQRRERLTQRAAVALFVVALPASLFLFGSSGTVTSDPAQPSDALPEVARFSWPHLIAGLSLLVALVVMGTVAGLRRPAPVVAQRGWRRYWFVLALAPMLYGPLLLVGMRDAPPDPTILVVISWALKVVTIPTLPVLVWLLAERAAQVRHRWLTLVGVWLVLGVGLVLTARGLISDIIELSIDRLWPDIGDNAVVGSLDDPPGGDWTAERVLEAELLSVVVLALLSGLAMRIVRSLPIAAAAVVPVVVFFSLAVYNFYVAPFGFKMDYDPFWGDLVLSGAFSELLFAIFPLDPFGALAISIASFSMVAMLWLWGGPVPADDPEWWKQQTTGQDDVDD